MMKIQLLTFPQHNDERGDLTVAEVGKQLPFEVRRFFAITQTDAEALRGCHANRFSQFVMVCLGGSVQVSADDGRGMQVFTLARPSQALFLGPMTWKEMTKFTAGAVLLVLSDSPYDAGEYIRDYQTFLNEVKP